MEGPDAFIKHAKYPATILATTANPIEILGKIEFGMKNLMDQTAILGFLQHLFCLLLGNRSREIMLNGKLSRFPKDEAYFALIRKFARIVEQIPLLLAIAMGERNGIIKIY